jgi:hypothetical protein
MARLFFLTLLLAAAWLSPAAAYDRCPGQAIDSCLSPRERYERDLYRSGHFGPRVGPHRLYREQLDRRPRGRSFAPISGASSYSASVRLAEARPHLDSVTRLDQVAPYLAQCMATLGKGEEKGEGRAATVRLAFRANGSVIAPVRVTAGAPRQGDRAQEAFVSGLLDAIARCTPLPLGGGFQNAIAGRPYLIRFIGGANKG